MKIAPEARQRRASQLALASLRCAQQGSGIAFRVPSRSESASLVRLRRSFRPCAAAAGIGAATSDAFDSPQESRTIVTCSKSAPPRTLAPQLVGAEVAHVRKGFARSGVAATSSSPTQMPTAEDLETQGGPADYGAQGRGRQPVFGLPLYSAVWTGGGIWVGLKARQAGGLNFVVAQALISHLRHR
jgi:hypothetical protein